MRNKLGVTLVSHAKHSVHNCHTACAARLITLYVNQGRMCSVALATHCLQYDEAFESHPTNLQRVCTGAPLQHALHSTRPLLHSLLLHSLGHSRELLLLQASC